MRNEEEWKWRNANKRLEWRMRNNMKKRILNRKKE